VPVIDFEFSLDDKELYRLTDYLMTFRKCQDVRTKIKEDFKAQEFNSEVEIKKEEELKRNKLISTKNYAVAVSKSFKLY